MRVPLWGAYLIGAVAIFTSIGFIFQKMIKPIFRFAKAIDEALPPLKIVAEVFSGDPNLVKVIHDMASQFQTNHGSSLRDVVNRLDSAATDNRQAAAVLAVGVEAAKQMADADRKQLQRLVILLDRLTVQVDTSQDVLAKGQARIEDTQDRVGKELKVAQTAVEGVASDLAESKVAVEGVASDLAESKAAVEGVASDLVVSQAAVDEVASDLAAAHARADEAHSDVPGEAADAASQSPPSTESEDP